MAEIKRFCSRCGSPVSATDDYCQHCGFHLDDVNTQATTNQPYTSAEDKKEKEKKKEYGIIALAAGIGGFILPYFGIVSAIIAIVIGRKYKHNDDMAKAGYTLGVISLIFSIISTVLSIVLIVLACLGMLPFYRVTITTGMVSLLSALL